MKEHDDPQEAAKSLTLMMGLGEAESLWGPTDLEAILGHQLSAPLRDDLVKLDPNLPERLAVAEEPPIETFADLFHHPAPPVEILDCVRRFAKACRGHPDSPLPDEIATVLYFLAISAAMTRCQRRITRMDDQSLRYSYDWALAQPWLDDDTRSLLLEDRQGLGDSMGA